MSAKVAGLGLISAGGVLNKETLFENCLNSISLPIVDSLFRTTEAEYQQLVNLLPANCTDLRSRCGVFSALALQAALEDSGWSKDDLSDCGFIFASTTSQIDLWEKTLPHYLKTNSEGLDFKASSAYQSLAAPSILLAEKFSIHGPQLHVASSCSASLQALAVAALWIKNKKVKRCLVGSAEIHSRLTEVGFSSLRLLSKTAATPFDHHRKGINLGEASAFICLEAADLNQNNTGWGFLNGFGLATDAYHPTAPHPEGKGSEKALRNALKSGRMNPNDIDWIYSHGTGSIANDLSESIALEKVFGVKTPVTSTKSIHGHTLATSGVLESVLGLMAMKKNIVLPTSGLTQQDPAIHLFVPEKPFEKKINAFIKNSLGFGGINASVLFTKEKGHAL